MITTLLPHHAETVPVPLAHRYTGPRDHSLLPGGFGKALTAVGPWSLMAVRGEGWRLWDDTGRELIDLHGNFTVNVHGNAHPAVVAAVEGAARSGLSFGRKRRGGDIWLVAGGL